MKTSRDVTRFVERVLTLPGGVPDFRRGMQTINPRACSRNARKMLEFFKPLLESVDWQGEVEGMDPRYRKRFEHSARLGAVLSLVSHFNDSGLAGLKQEAALAGVDLPTFTKQLLMTVTRVYAQIFTVQLFGLYPLSQPTGRIHFQEFVYDSNFTGSSPNISAGDRTDEDDKFNIDFYSAPEGTPANKIRHRYKKLTIDTEDWRVAAEWSDQFQDDSSAVYGDSAEGMLVPHLFQEMTRTVDRRMVRALVTHTPAAHTVTWDPTDGGNYNGYAPSEKTHYDENLVRVGINGVINKIQRTRKFTNDGMPEWGLCGADFALRLVKLAGFKANPSMQNREFDVQRGALRDMGELTSLGIRFLVDPLLKVDGSSDVCFFGRKPKVRGDVGLYWAPYVALQPTLDFYDPITGLITKAVRARDAIVQPNTTQEPASSQLAEVYGLLKVA